MIFQAPLRQDSNWTSLIYNCCTNCVQFMNVSTEACFEHTLIAKTVEITF